MINTHFSELNEDTLDVLLEQIRVRKDGFSEAGFCPGFGGGHIFLNDPQGSQFTTTQLAAACSREPRWCGRTRLDRPAYSVAEHCVMVSRLCRPEHAMYGLLHDLHEAVLKDVPTPLKRLIGPAYKSLELRWMDEVGLRCGGFEGLSKLPIDVKCADLIALEVERWDLLQPKESDANFGVWGHAERPTSLPTIVPVGEYEALAMWCDRYSELKREGL